jgi:aminoglycoside 6-adenylyltransferase
VVILPDILIRGTTFVDKDGLTRGLKPPTYSAHIPSKPTEADYLALVEEFWWRRRCGQNSCRDDLFPARVQLRRGNQLDLLRRMLEWYVELDHDWSLKPSRLGRGLEDAAKPGLWPAVEGTFVGADTQENWRRFFRTAALFRSVATEVADRLRYQYPFDLDRRMMSYSPALGS